MKQTPRGTLEEAFQFAQWALAMSKPPSLGDVEGFLGCNRKRARVWRNKWLKNLRAYGHAVPPADSKQAHDGNRSGPTSTERKAP